MTEPPQGDAPLPLPLSQEEINAMIHTYGDDWAIQYDQSVGVWTAVRYPTPTATRVVAGRSARELRDRLETADGNTGRPTLKGQG